MVGVDERRLFAEVLRIRYRVAEIANPLSQVKTGLTDFVTHATATTVQPQAELPFLYMGRMGRWADMTHTCPYSVTSNVHQLGANRPMPMRMRHMTVVTKHSTTKVVTSNPHELRLQFCFMSKNINDRLQVIHLCYSRLHASTQCRLE